MGMVLSLCAAALGGLGAPIDVHLDPASQESARAAAIAVPDVILNEVLFDPYGPAGSPGARPWVELYVRRDTSTRGLELRDRQDALLFRFPPLQVSAGRYLVVSFGPHDPELQHVGQEGALLFTSGQPFGAPFDVEEGGVRLARRGRTLDRLSWGTAGGPGPYVDLSHAGGRPMTEGDSLGRSRDSAWTGTAADWSPLGGRNADAPSAGAPNVVELPSAEDVVLYADAVVNGVFVGLNATGADQAWLEVDGTTPLLLSYRGSKDRVVAQVLQSFDLVVDGTPRTLRGKVDVTFTRSTADLQTGEHWRVTGQLTGDHDPSYGLVLQELSRQTSGGHAGTTTVDYGAHYVWRHAGVDHPVQLAGQSVESWTSDVTRHTLDVRSGTDFGGAGTKHASAEVTTTRQADGHYRCESTVTRSLPSLLPHPGQSQSAAGTEVLREDFTFVTEGLGMFSSSVSDRFERRIDGVLVEQLRPGAVGTESYVHTASGDTQQATLTADFPLQDAHGNPIDLHIVASATSQELGGKSLTTGTMIAERDGVRFLEASFAVDPPRGGGQPQDDERPWWRKTLDFGVTTLTCVAGGVKAQEIVLTTSGKKAMIKMFGKNLAKKLIPGVGWGVTAICVGKAVGDASGD